MNKEYIAWFSRHELTPQQLEGLKKIYGNNLEIITINKTIRNGAEYWALLEKETKNRGIEVGDICIHALVAPIQIVQEIMEGQFDPSINLYNNNMAFIFCKNKRVLAEDGKKTTFVFDGWFEYIKINIQIKSL